MAARWNKKLAYITAYHQQTQWVVESMNAVIEQCMRRIIHESGNMNNYKRILSTMELFINSLPKKSTGFTPFHSNYGHEAILPIQLIKGNEEIRTESVGFLVQRVISEWEIARENLKRNVGL